MVERKEIKKISTCYQRAGEKWASGKVGIWYSVWEKYIPDSVRNLISCLFSLCK